MIREEIGSKREGSRLIHLLLLGFAIVVNSLVVGVSAYFFYKYKMKPALGIETYADKLEKEYVWIADWMTVPSEKMAAIDRVIAINRKVRKETEDYRRIKRKIVDELLFFLDSPGREPRLRDRSINGIMALLDRKDADLYFYPLMEPLLYLPVNASDFWSSQIRQKIFLTLFNLDQCNPDLYDTAQFFLSENGLNPGEKMMLNGLISSIQLKCGKPVDSARLLLRESGWASLGPIYLAKKGIPSDIKKKLALLKDDKAPYRERGRAAQELGHVRVYKLYVLKEMLKVLEKLLPEKRETNTHTAFIRMNILYSLPKLKLCYKPMIKVMNRVWENRYVSTLERSIAASIIAKYNLNCTGKVDNPGKLKR